VKMQTLSEHRLFDDAPLYIRWNVDHPPIAVEVRLDLVARIARQIDAAASLDIEIGGILLGTPPSALSQTLRVEEFELIPRRVEDGQAFMLDPREHDRFLTTRWEAKTKGRTVVGIFRTHLRAGPQRPSLADRTLLASEFNDQIHLILLIDGRQSRTAGIFIGSRTALAEEPSIPEFRFNEAEFRALPELDSEPLPPIAEIAPRSRSRWLMGAGVFLIALLAAGAYLWFQPGFQPVFQPGSQPGFEPVRFLQSFNSSPGLDLTVTGNRTIRVGWNHSASAIGKAISAKLLIADGTTNREIPIGVDELRLGLVEYATSHPDGKVTLVLEMPGATSLIQSATWHTRS
jgi:proteasome lid subunit RPN8/RPN11